MTVLGCDPRPQQIEGQAVVYLPTEPPEGWQAVPQGGSRANVMHTRHGSNWRSGVGGITWSALLLSARSAGVLLIDPSQQ